MSSSPGASTRLSPSNSTTASVRGETLERNTFLFDSPTTHTSKSEEASSAEPVDAENASRQYSSASSIAVGKDAAARNPSPELRNGSLPKALFPTLRDVCLTGESLFDTALIDLSTIRGIDQVLDVEVVATAAWALVLQGYLVTDDVCFGHMATPGSTKICRVNRRHHETLAQHLDSVSSQLHSKVSVQDPTTSESTQRPHNTLVHVRRDPVVTASQPEPGELSVRSGYEVILTVDISHGNPQLALTYSYALLSPSSSQRVCRSLVRTLNTLIHHTSQSLAHFHVVDKQDIDLEPFRNLPSRIESSTHAMIKQRILLQPEAEAVVSWDRNLTYQELGSLASQLALKLRIAGVKPGVYVGICFSKSVWAILTIVAMQMSGATFVPLDPHSPLARWKEILSSVGGKIVLCGPEYATSFQSMEVLEKVVVVHEDFVTSACDYTEAALPEVHPADPSCILFTSGSTGKPKGIIMEHRTLCSLSEAHPKHTGVGPGTRVYQFSAYTFDAGITDILLTLIRGGCVCSPSEHDRVNDLAGSITRMNANWIFLTPSMAELLSPDDVPCLKTMATGGEVISPQLSNKWRDAVSLYGVYGPTEVSICAALDNLGYQDQQTSLGKPINSVFWVVDPSNTRRLVPDGSIGELMIQGPLLAKGYHDADEEKMRNWITTVDRLPEGIPTVQTYLTGDLVRKHADGTYEFMGRKDSQVKVHGQRIELGEVEARLLTLLPQGMRGAVEVTRSEHGAAESLAAMLYYVEGPRSKGPMRILDPVNVEDEALIRSVDAALRSQLPAYMIPSTYPIFEGVPSYTHSGKVDRKPLLCKTRELSKLQRKAFAGVTTEQQPAAATYMELKLRDLWAALLHIAAEDIGRNDSFLALGGDSITAVKLVSEAWQLGFRLSVALILGNPRLVDMALATELEPSHEEESVKAYELLPNGTTKEALIASVLTQCSLSDPEMIDNVYPCSPLQEGLMAIGAKQPGSYIGAYVYKLPSHIDLVQFKLAWNSTQNHFDILRTRIVVEDGTSLQVVVREEPRWAAASQDAATTLTALRSKPFGYGSRLSRFSLGQEKDGSPYLIWVLHHAVYDGWSMELILEHLRKVYLGIDIPRALGKFVPFVDWLHKTDRQRSSEFWSEELRGASRSSFPPSLPATSGSRAGTQAQGILKSTMTLSTPSCSSVTIASVFQAAWALLLSRYCETDDICFGYTVSGRNAPLARAHTIAGPMIATIPVRLLIDRSGSLEQFLRNVQTRSVRTIPHEQFGLHNMSRLSPDAAAACDFSSLLVIQPGHLMDMSKDDRNSVLVDACEDQLERMGGYSGYPLVLQVVLRDETADLVFLYDRAQVVTGTVVALSKQMEHTSQQLLNLPASTCLGSISISGNWDVEQAVAYNGPDLATYECCLTDLIGRVVLERPDQEAVCTSTTSMSYESIWSQSTVLASHLLKKGAQPKSIVPICFEQSPLCIIAMLAVLRAGCAFMPLDPSHPISRRQALVSEVDATIIITSHATSNACIEVAVDKVELSEELLETLREEEPGVVCLDATPGPDDLAYVLFTSGSTGKPKGVEIQHTAICTSILHYGRKHRVDATTRMLQFANYAFDASIYEIFVTLLHGGTICVPSEDERLSETSAFLRAKRVSMAFLTPSFVKTLDGPETLSDMKTLILMGEAPTTDVVDRWKQHVQLINGYGPTEASACCASYAYESCREGHVNSTTIGTKVHGNCWVVEPDNHNRLTPIGCVGELLIQGPALARGYFKDPEKTNASFLPQLAWGHSMVADTHTRFYKTGDLVRYTQDGTLEYVGRKDTQVKLRGQRLELGEIESTLQSSCPQITNTAVHMVGKDTGDFLVAFVDFTDGSKKPEVTEILPLNDGVLELLVQASTTMSSTLPSYMVPSHFIPLTHIPFVSSMKVDRKQLQSLAESLAPDILMQFSLTSSEKIEPTTANEMTLRSLWASVLELDPAGIMKHDNFLHIGGDSISAIQLSALARKNGYKLTVSDIFKNGQLSMMAEAWTSLGEQDPAMDAAPKPFSLLETDDVDKVLLELRQQCDLKPLETIRDAYPCTPLQEGLLALGVKHPGSYIAKHVYRLSEEADLHRLKAAWQKVYEICDNQRLRIVKLGSTSIQVLVDGDFEWEPTSQMTLAGFLQAAQGMNMSYGSKLCRSAIIEDPSGSKYLVWVIHHAQFDGWTMTLMLDALRKIYDHLEVTPLPPYSSFIKYASNLDMDKARTFWQDQLLEARPAAFPPLPANTAAEPRDEKVTRLISKTIEFPSTTQSSITKGTILRAAWALVLARYGSTDDVTFGATASGRNANVPGIERIAGTVIGTMPVRIRIDRQASIKHFLRDIQDQALDMVPFEQMGFQNIAKINADCQHACKVSSLLIVQPEKQMDLMQNTAAGIIERAKDDEYPITDTMEGYFTFPVVIQCPIYQDHVLVHFTYDSSVVTPFQMEALCHHFETAVKQLLVQGDTPVGQISLASQWDLQQASVFNKDVKESLVNDCVHSQISRIAHDYPDHIAAYSTSLSLTYRRLDTLSTQLAHHLTSQGVRTESVVPICFEKTPWTMVAMLGIMKAGGAFVPMDPSHPEDRRQGLIDQVKAKHLIVSPSVACSHRMRAEAIIELSEEFISALEAIPLEACIGGAARPENAAYILFTSGSTGKPKGIVVEHAAICSSIASHGKEFGLSPSSRVLQFASYVFDVSFSEILTTLAFGGTVCIPTATERMQDIVTFINESKADTAMLTPSFVTTFTPDQVPSLKTLVLGGEAPSRANLSTWQPYVRLLNGYAPAECCIYALTHTYRSVSENPVILGKGLHHNLWIVEPDDHDQLAPIGCVGELILQGNAIGRSYVNEPEKTALAFHDSMGCIPSDLQKPVYRFYKSGDLVKYDCYGNIEYLGRKDTQVKLRGQRIELGEIEHHITSHLPEAKYVAVEITKRNNREALVAFLSFIGTENQENEEPASANLAIPMSSAIRRRLRALVQELETQLPPYMVPGLFMPLRKMPFLSSLKIDRRRLRTLVDGLTTTAHSQLSLAEHSKQPPTTPLEMKLRDLWSDVLLIDSSLISRDDDFFQLGGDSLVAMQLSRLAQKHEIALTVADVFSHSTVAALAEVVAEAGTTQPSFVTQPWGLVDQDPVALVQDVRRQCMLLKDEHIEDVFPSTALQEGTLASSMKQPGAYFSTTVYRLSDTIELERFRIAWTETLRRCTNLRTRFVVPSTSTTGRPMQVVLAQSPGWEDTEGHTLISYSSQRYLKDVKLGSSLCRYALINQDGSRYFVLTMHHAIYDLWSQHLMLTVLEDAYHQRPQQDLIPYSHFVSYSMTRKTEVTRQFWTGRLAGATPSEYPRIKTPSNDSARMLKTFTASMPLPCISKTTVTTATVLRAAWAIVLARYSESDSACFGTTVSGRLAPLAGITAMPGPTIATVPLYLRLRPHQTVAEFLAQVQADSTEMIAHEQYGLQNIAKVHAAAKAACDFSTLLVVQPVQQVASLRNDTEGPIFEEVSQDESSLIHSSDLQDYFSYPLVVNCLTSADEVKLHIYYDSNMFADVEINALHHHLSNVVRQLMSWTEAPLGAVSLADQWDINKAIEGQPRCVNHHEPADVNTLFKRTVETHAELPAIRTDSETLTYSRLQTLVSATAQDLSSIGVESGMLILSHLSDPMLEVTTLLALHHLGAASVPCHEDSIDSILQRVNVDILLLSQNTAHLAPISGARKTVVLQDIKSKTSIIKLPSTSPDQPSLVNTGSSSEQAALFSHGETVAVAHAFAQVLKIDATSCVWSDDAADTIYGILTVLATLLNGGCVCMSNSDVEDLTQAINDTGATVAFLSSQSASKVDANEINNLELVAVGPEPLDMVILQSWLDSKVVEVLGVYGTMRAPVAAYHKYSASSVSAEILRQPVDSAFWVVERANPDQMVPLGCIGELLIESPGVSSKSIGAGHGAFCMHDLEFLPGTEARRVIKTDLLVRRNVDNTFARVAEHATLSPVWDQQLTQANLDDALRASLPSQLSGMLVTTSRDALVAAIWYSSEASPDKIDLDEMMAIVCTSLSLKIPQFMVPKRYVLLDRGLGLHSRKTVDKRSIVTAIQELPVDSLREIVITSSLTREAPTNPSELTLRALWATVLSLPAEDIGRNDNFLQIGGDSITAIQLVNLARNHGLELSISAIFKDARLSSMAAVAGHISTSDDTEIVEPFSLLDIHLSDSMKQQIVQRCSLENFEKTVQDVYPCTPLQEGLLALSVTSPGSYMARHVFRLGSEVDLETFGRAWERTVETSSNLRTRIVNLNEQHLQVVLQEPVVWESTTNEDLPSYLNRVKRSITMSYGTPLSRCALVNGEYFVWTVHHAVSDGWSMQIILDRLQANYHRLHEPPIVPFSHFIKHVRGLNSEEARTYWRQQLDGAQQTRFPDSNSHSRSTSRLNYKFSAQRSTSSITMASVIRATWAFLLSHYAESGDVCFGTTVSGRQSSVQGVESVSGPMIATVPVRVRVNPDETVESFVQRIQDQSVNMVPFEQYGLQNIAKCNAEAEDACNFSSLLAIQPASFKSEQNSSHGEVLQLETGADSQFSEDLNGYYTYPLVLQIKIHESGIEMDIAYSSQAISSFCVEALAHHFEHVTAQLISQGDTTLSNLAVAGPWDLQLAVDWNTTERLYFADCCVHHLFQRNAKQNPDKEALYSTERSLTYSELDKLSTLLARELQQAGVTVETIVPFCFEKSIWAVVAILAILKAGGAFMPLDPAHPDQYRLNLIRQTQARVVLCSPETKPTCEYMAETVLSVSSSMPCFQRELDLTQISQPDFKSGADSAAYVLFSSGSTGIPKGIVVTHGNFCANLEKHRSRFGFSTETRLMQFCNFVFDVSASDVLGTLAIGGTVCMPTERERLQDTTPFITESRSNIVSMTPSFIKTIHPDQVPTLRTLISGGEPVTQDILRTWVGRVRLINGYGPAEATIYSVTHEYSSVDEEPATIGRGFNNAVWVMDQSHPDRLAPLGCVGELVLQGPAVSRGYLNDPGKTDAVFSDKLTALPAHVNARMPRFYRTGDLVQYRTCGELVYVGRRDAQVKLRGQRLELGQIESGIRATEHTITQTVVDVLRRDSLEALVAFIQVRAGATRSLRFDSEDFRDFAQQLFLRLREILPAHMVPKYYVPVDAMPQTSSGKTDRKSLRGLTDRISTEELAQYAPTTQHTFRACSTPTECKLAGIWSKILGMEAARISADGNFHDMGGDSIRVVTLMRSIEEQLGYSVPLAVLNSRRSTIATTAAMVDGHVETGVCRVNLMDEIEMVTEASWASVISDPCFKSSATLPNEFTVFLTGGTGFLGTQLLRQLLGTREVRRVIALVRAKNEEEALERLRRTGTIAGWWEEDVARKIEPWTGDLASSRLGLDVARWDRLCGKAMADNVDAIVHNGAVVDWTADYDKLRRANVQSTVSLLRAAVESPSPLKLVFVSGGANNDMGADRAETAREMEDNIGYSQTKFVAEAAIHSLATGQSTQDQNRLSTVRPGIIIGTATEAVANVDDFIWRLVAASAELHIYPVAAHDTWIPLDDASNVAKTILQQLTSDEIQPHVDLVQGLSSADFWQAVLSALPGQCEPAPWAVWLSRALERMNFIGEKHPLWPVQHFLGELGQPQFPPQDARGDRTALQLAVKRNVQYLCSIGYIRAESSSVDASFSGDVIRRQHS